MKLRKNLCLLAAAFSAAALQAQQLPLDPLVRRGTLPNGLTYYIAHNAQTPQVADFYIAQRVGSILEEPRQRGLAHFSSTWPSTARSISPAATTDQPS